MITEKQIEHGFWFWDKANDFPPESITYPSEYNGQTKVNIACTQLLELSAIEQNKLIKEWIDFLPTCQEIEMLWFTTNTTQKLFDSVCKLKNLIGLNIKWSNIKSLDKIVALEKIKYLSIGSSSQIESILPISTLKKLEVLRIENFKKISDFSSMSALINLKFFSIEGGMYTKQKVDTFEPFSKLTNLIYFSAVMISCVNKGIDPILKLKNLKTLNWAFDLTLQETDRLKEEMPNLINFPNRHYQNNMEKLKSPLS